MRFLSSMFGLFAASTKLEMPPLSQHVADKPKRRRLWRRSRYMPHQGKQERARRLRQWAKIEAGRVGS